MIISVVIFGDNIILKFNRKIFVFISLFLWIFIGVINSNSLEYSKIKALEILYTIIVPIILISIFSAHSRNLFNSQHLVSCILGSVYLSVWFIFFAFLFTKQTDESGRYFLPGIENSIYFNRFIALFLLIIIIYTTNSRFLFLKYVTILFCIYLIIQSASKGPILSLIITLLYFKTSKINISLILKITFWISAFVLIMLLFFKENYLLDTNFYSVYERLNFFDLIKKNLSFNYFTGIGTGGFGIFFFNEDSNFYPHNIFVELFVENGIIAVALFVIIIFFYLKNINKNNFLHLIAFYFLLASQTSGNLPSNNYLFVLLFSTFLISENTISSLQKK